MGIYEAALFWSNFCLHGRKLPQQGRLPDAEKTAAFFPTLPRGNEKTHLDRNTSHTVH